MSEREKEVPEKPVTAVNKVGGGAGRWRCLDGQTGSASLDSPGPEVLPRGGDLHTQGSSCTGVWRSWLGWRSPKLTSCPLGTPCAWEACTPQAKATVMCYVTSGKFYPLARP